MKNRVLVITTEGCEACEFMQRIVAKAYSEAKVEDTSLGIYDFQDKEIENLIEQENVIDFPTTLLIKDGLTICKIVGTMTKDELIEKIKHFEDN